MSLRKKMLLAIGVMLICPIVIVYVLSRTILANSFATLEDRNVRQHVSRAISALEDEVATLNTTVYDWAAWDDTYAFVQDPDEAYIQSNLVDETFAGARLNFMLFVDRSGYVVFGKGFDWQSAQARPLSGGLQAHLDDGLLLRHSDPQSYVAGILSLPDGLALVSSRPILTSEDQGPIRGTLIMGRYLDAAVVDRLAETTHLSLALYWFDAPLKSMPADFKAARSALSPWSLSGQVPWPSPAEEEKAQVLVRSPEGGAIAGYAMLPDIYGEPALILRVDLPRDIYREGQTSMTYLLLSFLVVGSAGAGAFWWLLDKMVIARLARLNADVNDIGRRSDVAARLSIKGSDELSSLARSINGMLEALERSHYELKESEEKFRSFVQQSVDGVFLTDEHGRLTLWNQAQEQIMGLERTQVLGQPLWEVQFRLLPEHKLDADARERIEAGVRQFFGGEPANWVDELHEQEIQRPDGTRRIVQSLTFSITDPHLPSLALTCPGGQCQGAGSTSEMAHRYRIGGISRDVTERVRVERALRESEARYRLLFNSGNDMVFVSTLNAQGMPGQVIEANEEAYRRMGYTREELADLSLVELAAPEKRDGFIEVGQRFLAEGVVLFETVGVTREGTRVPLEVSAQMFDLRGQPAVLAVARDITERKRTEMALSQRLLEQASLFAITQLVSSTLQIEEVMQVVVEQMAHLVDASSCVILEWNPESGLLTSRARYIRPEYRAPGAPVQYVEASYDLRDYPAKGVSLREQEPFVAYVDDEQADPQERDLLKREGWYGVAGIPLFVQDQALGLVQVYLARAEQSLEEHDIRLLQTLANQVAVTVQNARLFEALQAREANLRDLSRRLINVQERERRHIAQELHDELGQILTATKINIDLARRKFSQIEPELEADEWARLQKRLDEASDLTDRVLTSVRTMTVELRPTLLDDMGIVPTLRWYVGRFADRTGIRVQLKVPKLPARLVPEIETAIYRGVQEALTNVARHAQAGAVQVRLACASDMVTASIEDDGHGFDVQAWTEGQGWRQSLGLAGIQERVNLLDGYVNVISQPGQGTRIEMALPARFQPEDGE